MALPHQNEQSRIANHVFRALEWWRSITRKCHHIPNHRNISRTSEITPKNAQATRIPPENPDVSTRLENTGVRANRSMLVARSTYAAARELRRACMCCAGDLWRRDTNLWLST